MLRINNFIAASSINRLKFSLMGCAASSALSDHISIMTFTAYPETAMLQYSCRSFCCPHPACTSLISSSADWSTLGSLP